MSIQITLNSITVWAKSVFIVSSKEKDCKRNLPAGWAVIHKMEARRDHLDTFERRPNCKHLLPIFLKKKKNRCVLLMRSTNSTTPWTNSRRIIKIHVRSLYSKTIKPTKRERKEQDLSVKAEEGEGGDVEKEESGAAADEVGGGVGVEA